jgi:hypothetical protein
MTITIVLDKTTGASCLKFMVNGEGTKSDCSMRNQSLDVRSTTLLVRQYVGSHCA